jgi:hypothetical protein
VEGPPEGVNVPAFLVGIIIAFPFMKEDRSGNFACGAAR